MEGAIATFDMLSKVDVAMGMLLVLLVTLDGGDKWPLDKWPLVLLGRRVVGYGV